MKMKLVDIFRICTSSAFLSALFAGAVSCVDGPLSMPDEGKTWAVAVEAETSASTRVSLEGLKMTWDKADKLELQAGTAESEYAVAELSIYDVDAGLSRAKFKGEVTLAAAPVDCAFAYPVAAASFSGGQMLFDYAAQDGSHSPFLYGYSLYDEAGMEVAMHHVGSMLQISNSIGNLSEITVKSNAGEKLYAVVCDAESGAVSLSETAADNFTVVPASGTFGSEICIAMPPVNLAKGFTLICKTTDNSVMYKSYSSDGTSSAGYDFSLSENRGRLYPISLGAFDAAGIKITSLVAEHTYDSNQYLTGTEVKVSLDKSGTANKIIDKWEATLVNSSGEVVRTYSSATKPASAVLSDSEDVPYLIPGTYTLTACYYMFGNKAAETMSSVEVTVPDIIDVSAQTTYSLYKDPAKGAAVANKSGHSSMAIFDIGATLKVSDELFNHSKYKGSFTVTYSTDTGLTSGAMLASSQSHSLGFDVEVASKQKYIVTATLSFGGYSYSSSIDCHITGLPYEVSFVNNANPAEWTLSNTALSDKRLCLKVTESSALSPAFHVPDDIAIETKINAYAYSGSVYWPWKMYLKSTVSNNAVNSGKETTLSNSNLYADDATFEDIYDKTLILTPTAYRVSYYMTGKRPTGTVTTDGRSVGIVCDHCSIKYR